MLDKEVAGAILPSSNFDAFSALLHGPLRAIIKTSLMAVETIISSSFALATQPENAPLILINAASERLQDPLVVFNSLIKSTLQTMSPSGGLL